MRTGSATTSSVWTADLPVADQGRPHHAAVHGPDPAENRPMWKEDRRGACPPTNGEISFEDAALRYSEDDATSAKGGELPMFGTGKMIEEFEDVCFALPTDGAIISEPSRPVWDGTS